MVDPSKYPPFSTNASPNIEGGRASSSTWTGAPFAALLEVIGFRKREEEEDRADKKQPINEGGGSSNIDTDPEVPPQNEGDLMDVGSNICTSNVPALGEGAVVDCVDGEAAPAGRNDVGIPMNGAVAYQPDPEVPTQNREDLMDNGFHISPSNVPALGGGAGMVHVDGEAAPAGQNDVLPVDGIGEYPGDVPINSTRDLAVVVRAKRSTHKRNMKCHKRKKSIGRQQRG